MGAAWELDDRMTAYSAAALAANGLDGGKVLLRLADDDAGTAPTLEACARAVDECAAHGLPIMVEPLPYHHDPTTGAAKLLDDEDALLRAVAVGSGLGSTSTATWLKVPAGKNPQRMLSCTTLPALILGGTPGPDPEATYASWVRGDGGAQRARPRRRARPALSTRRRRRRRDRARRRRSSARRSRRRQTGDDDEAHHRPGDREVPDRPAHDDRRRRGAAVPGRVRDLRARQRDLPRAGAGGGARRTADVARPERAGHGARRRRLRQGDAAPPDHGRHVVDRTRRDQHGHRRRRRPLQSTAAAAARRRHVPAAGSPIRCCSRSSTSTTRR